VSPAVAFPLFMALLALFRPEQNGVVRALLVLAVAALLVGLRIRPAGACPRLARAAAILAGLALAFDVGVAAVSIVHSARTGAIYLDQGENTRAAARMLARGENPYGARALIDTELYRTAVPHPDMARAELARSTLDPGLRDALVPAPDHRFGHKYGPLNALLALPFVLAFGAAGIPLLNLLYFLGFVALVAHIVRRLGAPPLVRALVLLAVTADIVAVAVFLRNSAQDIGCMAACAAAVAADRDDRPDRAGLLVGLALAMKVVPAALFVPLLARRGRWRALALGVALALALHLPFLIWDAPGLLYNLLGWSLVRPANTTSWIHFAPPALAALGRGLLALVALALVVDLVRDGPSFSGLALLTAAVLLAGSSLHDNYVPWLSWLVYLALADQVLSSTAAMASGGSGGGATPSRRRAWGSSIMSTLT
jgi:hypothetical protein